MILLSHCNWEIRVYGWAGKDRFRRYRAEAMVDTEYYIRFGAILDNQKGAGTWVGCEIPDTPIELRLGITWFSPFYNYKLTESADETLNATFRINLP